MGTDTMFTLENPISLKYQFFPKWSRFNTIPISIPASFFCRNWQVVLKCIRKHEEPKMPKTILIKNKSEWLTLPNFKTYYETTIMK